MSTIAELERVERELRDDASPHLGDGWSLHRKRQADTIAAYVKAQREQAERNRAEYVNTKPTLPEPPKESIDDWPRHIDGLEREPPKENPNG